MQIKTFVLFTKQNECAYLVAVVASLLILGLSGATKKEALKNNSGVKPAGQCGTWVKEGDGGLFTSPNYPSKYPPGIECVYIIEAPPRLCIHLFFNERYSIEPSWECKFDNIEVRDGPFGFSPVIGRYCGQTIPPFIRSSGRYLWVKFVSDGELEAIGFSVNYNFTAGKNQHEVFTLHEQSQHAERQPSDGVDTAKFRSSIGSQKCLTTVCSHPLY
ncbi:unnamed protein product [Oncorhynchus mykiss]|uniref:CUB domain-containing protein n=1 Tax=Oncorhynchus mykiss TaxID=8022 RepID=A0A060Y7M4_ONCMY|nr:unnamed protein product [Oncorhynchus mykiss]